MLVEEEQALEAADADVRMAEPDEHRRAGRRGLVAAHQLLAGLDQAEGFRGVDAERLQHLGGEDFAHAALQRQPAVGGARPGRAAAALGAEIEQPAVLEIVHLGEEEAAAVAELGVVGAELVAVVAQRQRRRVAAGQWLEAAEMVEPFGVGEGAQADALGPALVAVAQDMLGELRRLDLVVEVAAKCGMGEGRAEVLGNGHASVSRPA